MTNQELDARLEEALLAYDTVNPATLARARELAGAHTTLAGALVRLQLVPGDVIGRLLQEITGAPNVDPSLMTVYSSFVERTSVLLPAALVGRLLVFPAQMDVDALHVCMLNPADGWTIAALEAVSGCRIEPMVAHEEALRSALEQHYRPYVNGPFVVDDDGEGQCEAVYRELLSAPFESYVAPAVSLVNRQRDAIVRDRGALEGVLREPTVIRLVQQLLVRAIEANASDIHVESLERHLRVRVRVDGVLRTMHEFPSAAAPAVLGRLKAMAGVPVDSRASAIDGRISSNVAWGRAVDLRFSLIPSVTGEKIVLRVLDRSSVRRSLADLGMTAGARVTVEDASDLPNGLILVTGPTGSGKSSTLYAILDRLNSGEVAIVTAEDPVESRIGGVMQVPCDEHTSMTFASALRAFLRQDPDVMMIGEIRDTETADIAMKSALTGHVVLSTLHANDAANAILRLVNMDLEPFVIASALRLVVAQRLIRRLCAKCRADLAPGSIAHAEALRRVPPDRREGLAGTTIYEPTGCPECLGTGYRGRVGIFEVLRVTDAIEEAILARRNARDIRQRARSEGMQSLRDAAFEYVRKGDTSIAEMLEHTMSQE